MTDREKLIELLREVQYLGGLEERITDHLIASGVTFATDNNDGGKWIPVTEGLPDSECIAVGYQNEMLIGWVDTDKISETGYAAESNGEILRNVTHWMPLPEPPKGE